MKYIISLSAFTLFVCAWALTELAEYRMIETFTKDVYLFMYKGERFTAEEGIILEYRIEKLEEAE